MKYSENKTFWTDKAITQLGYSINLFTTVEIAFLGYLINSKSNFPIIEISCEAEFSCILFFYISAIILVILSTGYGFLAILSRLCDFKLTRHIVSSKEKHPLESKESRNNKCYTIDIKMIKYYPFLCKCIRGKIDKISAQDNKRTIIKKFNKLRLVTEILGNITWSYHKYQILLFFISLILYGITILF